MEKIILNIWYSNQIFYRLVSYVLVPISLLYLLIFYLIRILKTEHKIDIPIICIGNINLGGTGKTSTLLEIINHFKINNKNICVLLKGYGGKKTIFKKVSPDESAVQVGDEAILYSNHVPTYISTNRRLAVKKILDDVNPDFILLDDGFQDKSLFKDKNILMVNGERGFGNGLCLPAGPLRELIKPALKKAEFLIIVGNDKSNIKGMYKNLNIDTLIQRLDSVSEINYTDKIKKPILLIHGTYDTQVPHNQSSVFYNKIKNSNDSVEYFEIPKATHYFDEQGNRFVMFREIERFLAENLN